MAKRWTRFWGPLSDEFWCSVVKCYNCIRSSADCQTAVQEPVPSSEVKITHLSVDSVGMKGEVVPLRTKQAHRWCRVQHYPFLTLALEWSGWSTPRPAALPPGEIGVTHYIGDWVGLGALGIWTLDPSARSKSLYRLRYLVPLSRHVLLLFLLVSWWILLVIC